MSNASNEEINYLTAEVRRLREELEGAQNRALLVKQRIYRTRAEEREAILVTIATHRPSLDRSDVAQVSHRPCCRAVASNLVESITSLIRARAEEREACAQLVHQRYEEVDSETGVEGELLRLEEAIRARGKKK